MERIDEFNKYIKNQMDKGELNLFQKELTDNETLRNDFKTYLLGVETVSYNGLKDEVRKAHQKHKKSQGFRLSFLRVAAVVIFGLLGFTTFWVASTNGEELLTQTPLSYVEPNHRGATEDKKEAEKLYIAKDYIGVSRLYKANTKQDEKLIFLAAMSYYNMGNYGQALQIIQTVENNPKNSNYASEYQFYKCQSLIGLERYAEALTNINSISKESTYYDYYDWKFRLKIKLLNLKSNFSEGKTK